MVLATLHLRDQYGMVILAVGVEPDRAKGRHRQAQVPDRVTDFVAVHGFRVVHCLRGGDQGSVGFNGVGGGMRVIALEEFVVKFFGA